MQNLNSKKIAIIGGGILGLTLALRLAERGAKVTLFEAANEIGGLASAWQIGDVIWDKHYHVTLLSDSFTRQILRELDLENEMQFVETKTGFYTDGKLVSMSNSLEFLRFPPLDLISKFRLGATIFYASKVNDWKALEKIPVEDWLTRLSGKRTFQKMWLPLLKAKLGDAYRQTSAAFIWATIQRMYAARNSGLKKEMFGYVRGGYAKVFQKFGEKLQEKGVEIRLKTKVLSVFKESNILKVDLTTENTEDTEKTNDLSGLSENKQSVAEVQKSSQETSKPSVRSVSSVVQNSSETFDLVILTAPSNVCAKIVKGLSAEEIEKLNGVKYQGIVCASMLTKKSLSNFYVTNITDETPFTGIIEMSALVDKSEFGGNALIYLPKYVAPDDELFSKTDAEIEEVFLSALEKMYAHFRREDVLSFKISRVRNVFPIPTLNYSESILGAKTSVENVFIVNSSQITNGTLNVNETIQLAENFFQQFLNKIDRMDRKHYRDNPVYPV